MPRRLFKTLTRQRQRWKQRWIGLGLILEMQGGIQDGAMVLEGPLYYVRQRRTTLLRGTKPIRYGIRPRISRGSLMEKVVVMRRRS